MSEQPAGLTAVIVAADFSNSFAKGHKVSAVIRRNGLLLNACGPGCRFVLVDNVLAFFIFLPRAFSRLSHHEFFI